MSAHGVNVRPVSAPRLAQLVPVLTHHLVLLLTGVPHLAGQTPELRDLLVGQL